MYQWTCKGRPGGRARMLVTGAGGDVGQSVLRALDRSALASWVVTTDCEPLSAGLAAADRGYVVPRARADGYAESLRDVIRSERIDGVLVGPHEEVLPLARRRAWLESETGARIVVGAQDVVARCHDKARAAEWMASVGIPHAATAAAENPSAVEGLVGRFGFPLVVKPREGYGSDNVVTVENRDALSAAVKPGTIIQQCVGDPMREYTAATFSDRAGRCRAAVVLHRHLRRGTSFRVELTDDAALRAEVTRWAEALGVTGSCNFQFRMTAGGPAVFEINYRFSGTSSIRSALGFNDVAMSVRHFVLGEEVEPPIVRRGVALRLWEEIILLDQNFESLARQARPPEGGP